MRNSPFTSLVFVTGTVWTAQGSNPGGVGARFYTHIQPDPEPTQPPVQRVLDFFAEGKATGAWRWQPTPIWHRG